HEILQEQRNVAVVVLQDYAPNEKKERDRNKSILNHCLPIFIIFLNLISCGVSICRFMMVV
ncbi:MAG: hypothetical protein ACFFC6_05130, partial [Promethearchaeota archaeon]